LSVGLPEQEFAEGPLSGNFDYHYTLKSVNDSAKNRSSIVMADSNIYILNILLGELRSTSATIVMQLRYYVVYRQP